MDIKPKQTKNNSVDNSQNAIAPTTTQINPQPIKNQFKAGQINQASAKLMIPPAISAKLSAISKTYNLPIDLSAISLQNATPENIKALRSVTDLLAANSKLLPELMKLTSQLLKADIKLGQFHANLTKAAIKHQEKIDKNTADIWLAMAGYGAKSSKLEHRTNTRNQLIEARNQAYGEYYQNSVYGNELKVIDAEYQVLASNRQILADSKIQRKNSAQERKQKLQEYIDSAYSS
jgi:hypothetical protein